MRWLVDANPDGSATRSRDNANGADVNRNWPTDHSPSESHGPEPLSEPETAALLAEIEGFRPDVIVAMHSAREGPFANYDGPGEALATAFAVGASVSRTWEVVPAVDWPTPGSLGTHFGRGLGIPVVTVEGNRWDDPAAILPEVEAGLDALLAAAAGAEPGAAPVCSDHRVGHTCTDLTRRVDQLLEDRVDGGTSGFLLRQAGGLVAAARWADVPIYPASSIKVVHWLHLMRLAADDPPGLLDIRIPTFSDSCAGTGTETREPLGDLVEQMLLGSDNDAANAIQRWIGPDALNATAASVGMVSTRIEHGFGCGGPSNDPANVGTIADLVTLYDGVSTGDTLDGPARAQFLDSMLDITDVVLEILGAEAATDVRIVAKAGWYGLDRSIGGIAFTPEGTFGFGAYVSSPRALWPEFRIEEVVAELLRDRIAQTVTP